MVDSMVIIFSTCNLNRAKYVASALTSIAVLTAAPVNKTCSFENKLSSRKNRRNANGLTSDSIAGPITNKYLDARTISN